MPALDKAIYKVLFECLKLSSGDSLLILVDEATRDLGQLFFKRASRSKMTVAFLEILPLNHRQQEPPPAIIKMMNQMSAVLSLTSHSLIHSNAIKQICHNGSRIICLNPISIESLGRLVNTDYSFINWKSHRLADLFSIGKKIQLITGEGTNLTIPIVRHQGAAHSGIASEPGIFCALPSGEASVVPDRRGTKGTLVVDGSITSIGLLETPIVMNVKDGYAYQITGGSEVSKLRKIMKPFGKQARNIAEFGVGTNPRALLTGNTIEDEKALGTAHIALGNPNFEGGSLKINFHLDCVIQKPTITIDGHLVIERGNLLV